MNPSPGGRGAITRPPRTVIPSPWSAPRRFALGAEPEEHAAHQLFHSVRLDQADEPDFRLDDGAAGNEVHVSLAAGLFDAEGVVKHLAGHRSDRQRLVPRCLGGDQGPVARQGVERVGQPPASFTEVHPPAHHADRDHRAERRRRKPGVEQHLMRAERDQTIDAEEHHEGKSAEPAQDRREHRRKNGDSRRRRQQARCDQSTASSESSSALSRANCSRSSSASDLPYHGSSKSSRWFHCDWVAIRPLRKYAGRSRGPPSPAARPGTRRSRMTGLAARAPRCRPARAWAGTCSG